MGARSATLHFPLHDTALHAVSVSHYHRLGGYFIFSLLLRVVSDRLIIAATNSACDERHALRARSTKEMIIEPGWPWTKPARRTNGGGGRVE